MVRGGFMEEKKLVNITIFLIKDSFKNHKQCLKNPESLNFINVKEGFGFQGKICICESSSKTPQWKYYLDEFAGSPIDMSDNTSNKAVMILKISSRLMAIVFGYGRSLLNEEAIELNFGLKTALNIIDPKRMRSVNATTIEDVVVTTQRQASYSTDQDEFGINITSDIMKGVTGNPFDPIYGNTVSGKDSLIVSTYMELSETKERLELYLKAYFDKRYRDIGFSWIDNIGEVRDTALCDQLNSHLVDNINTRSYTHLNAAPPEIIDWEHIKGFCFSGMGKNKNEEDNYNLDFDIEEYIDKIRPGTILLDKLKRDRLYAITSEEIIYSVCNVYSAIVFQTSYNHKTFILYAGSWYKINNNFYETVTNYVDREIPISNIILPECTEQVEEKYNELVTEANSNYCLMDQKMVRVEGGPKKIEACDIFTTNKQFIHVKFKSRSAQLSHLFSQGKVSAQCFISDAKFRQQVSEIAIGRFGKPVFNYNDKPVSNEYEVIYVIIDKEIDKTSNRLPFFSLVNLMLTAQELERMHMKYSIKIVKKSIVEIRK